MNQFGSFALDTSNECLWREGTQIELAPKPFSVLRYLVENPGRLITHDELLDAVWPATYVQPQVLRTYMLELRKVLGDDASRPRFIQTIPKRGYRFVAAVRQEVEAAHASGEPTPALKFSELVGRDAELVRLQTQAQLVAGGQRQVVFITGGAGIGKTSLVNAFCALVNETSAGASVVCGQSVEGFGKEESYYPIVEALGQLCGSTDQERVREILTRVAPPWLPVGGERLKPQFRILLATLPVTFAKRSRKLLSQGALILVLEDLQWADEPTLELISALARRRTPTKLMVLATYRPEGRSTEHPLRALKQDLVVRQLCTELALPPLSKPAVKQLLSRRLGQESLPYGLDEFIYQFSEGNPLFVLSLIEHVIAERFLVRKGATDNGQWEQLAPFQEMEIGVPHELGKLIELELDRLSITEQHVLEAGSLMPIAFPAWAVAAALEANLDEVEDACDELARRTGLVQRAGHDDLPDGTRSDFYAFTHGLYREVLYRRQATARRAKGHVRIAERLRELFAGREDNVAREMAVQYEAAGNWQRAAQALKAAARHAHERYAYQEEAQLLEHALRIAENLNQADRSVLQREIEGALRLVRLTIGGNGQPQNAD